MLREKTDHEKRSKFSHPQLLSIKYRPFDHLGNVFRCNLGQVALNVVRIQLVNVARATHTHFVEASPEAIMFISGNVKPDDADGIRVSGEIVDNALSPTIFGLVVLVEHYPCSIRGVSGFIDFKFVINQVEDPLITPEQIKIIAGDANLIIGIPSLDIQKQISAEWNS